MVKKPCVLSALLLSGLIAGTTLSGASQAAETSSVLSMVDLYGDFRFRFEQDWDSARSNGTERDDRARARIRGRIGLKITPNEFFDINTRLRTGAKDSQQSPHWTIADFSNNSTGTHALVFDKWYGKIKKDHLWAWGGRNGLPIWKQNELLWDDDATVIGGALGVKKYALGPGKLSLNTGYVLLPDGMRANHGDMKFGQLVYSTKFNDIAFTAAGGVLVLDGDSSTPNVLRQGNGNRDYTIWVGNLQAKTKISGLPVSLGFDVMHNSEDYNAAELAGTPAGTTDDDTDGYVIQVRLGKNSNQGDWLIGYSYADIETLAINASYAQDDWMRWGSSTQTDASDFHGHEFRAAYVLPRKIKVLARLYSVESNNNPQDGNRFRIDFNRKF
ncbi:MAG: putative porin [Proteobacteria bacterium]|nr:putative porin [Pseudomonadota bacterium]